MHQGSLAAEGAVLDGASLLRPSSFTRDSVGGVPGGGGGQAPWNLRPGSGIGGVPGKFGCGAAASSEAVPASATVHFVAGEAAAGASSADASICFSSDGFDAADDCALDPLASAGALDAAASGDAALGTATAVACAGRANATGGSRAAVDLTLPDFAAGTAGPAPPKLCLCVARTQTAEPQSQSSNRRWSFEKLSRTTSLMSSSDHPLNS
mmetsp:Transcript_111908/g.316238  ORF Transcript_111908/g.316238 Transcript_111908/m.316238 type:complete len:210 (+) Transcript_111908:648-1277(+)